MNADGRPEAPAGTTGTPEAAAPAPANPAAAVHAIHTALSLDELAQALVTHAVAPGMTFSVQFLDSRSGGFSPGPCGPGSAAALAPQAAVHLRELLDGGDGRIVAVDDLVLDDGALPASAVATLKYRGEAYGILVIQSEAPADTAFWQPVADALSTELVKIQLYESASRESAEAGAKLFSQRGCTQCHSVDGKPGIGPSMRGLVGRERSLSDGSTVVADENYIRESILAPKDKLVAGYGPVMPTFAGKLGDPEIGAIIAYLETLED